jgi:hypothetical protein
MKVCAPGKSRTFFWPERNSHHEGRSSPSGMALCRGEEMAQVRPPSARLMNGDWSHLVTTKIMRCP